MRSIPLNTVTEFKYWDFEKLQFTEIFRNEFINISIDIYDVGVVTPMMYKNRPKGSNKIVVPFQGVLRITTSRQSKVFDPEKDGLQLVIIGHKEKRQFANVGSIPVKVLAIYAPPFHISEIAHIPDAHV